MRVTVRTLNSSFCTNPFIHHFISFQLNSKYATDVTRAFQVPKERFARRCVIDRHGMAWAWHERLSQLPYFSHFRQAQHIPELELEPT